MLGGPVAGFGLLNIEVRPRPDQPAIDVGRLQRLLRDPSLGLTGVRILLVDDDPA